MAAIDDLRDMKAAYVRLERRLRQLETASPLGHSSISEGTGLAVNIPAGVHVEGSGSMTAGAASMSRAAGGRVGAGTTFIRPDGIWDADGDVKFLTNISADANINAAGVVRGALGVEAPLESGGPMTSLGPAVKEADRKGQSGYDNAMAARDEASAAMSRANLGVTKADTAQGRADSAYTLASQAKTAADTAQGDVDGIKNGSVPLQNPTLVGPKMTGLTSGGIGGGWTYLLVNTATGLVRGYGD